MRRPGGGLCPYPLAHGEEEFFLDSLCPELAHPEQIEFYAKAWAHRINASADEDDRRRKQRGRSSSWHGPGDCGPYHPVEGQ